MGVEHNSTKVLLVLSWQLFPSTECKGTFSRWSVLGQNILFSHCLIYVFAHDILYSLIVVALIQYVAEPVLMLFGALANRYCLLSTPPLY
jgi:hypothetical protein